MSTLEQKTVLETILDWSEEKPDWLRDALRRIIADGTPSDETIDELYSLCRKAHGDDEVDLEAVPLEAKHLPVDPGVGESISLASLSDVVGVNQLAAKQTLDFETSGLTVIYGKNGTGKSGYARVLKKACRARYPGEIMPDMLSSAPPGLATAKIEIQHADGSRTPIDWIDDDHPDPALSAITVFDRDSGAAHIRKKNEVWFRPFGLDIPDDLAATCKKVKAKLDKDKTDLEALRDPIFNAPTWSVTSTPGKFLTSLTHTSDITTGDFDTPLTEEETARLTQLTTDLAQDPTKIAGAQRSDAQRLTQLIGTMKTIEALVSASAISDLETLGSGAKIAREVANLAATAAFGELILEGVGKPVWRTLWESARAYSATLKNPPQDFPPQADDVCVTCHQFIDEETAARMSGFETFIQQNSETKAKNAEVKNDAAQKRLRDLRIDMAKVSPARMILRGRDAALAKKVLQFMAAARLRRCTFLKAGETDVLTLLPAIPEAEIAAMSAEIETYAVQLSASSGPQAREMLVVEHNELKDRSNAVRLKEIAITEIARLKTLNLIEACLKETGTRAITRLGNRIADELITPNMQDRFQEEITQLADSSVRVKVERSGGQFGTPKYEVRFFANEKAKVHLVLSEGEQTCVALATYLTELANASHTSALVFDDPVTSLDHRWRRKVAQRLVKEAGLRQVIVFTHDLVFLNDLASMANEKNVTAKYGSLERKSGRVGVYSEGLPWRAASLGHRIDTLEKEAREAKKMFENGDEEDYAREVRRIYGRLRATWERGIETIVFANVLQRQREYVNTKNLRKVVVLEDSDIDVFEAGFKKCCDFTDAHDGSMGLDAEVPPPTELLGDIQALKGWADVIKQKRRTAPEPSARPR